MLVFKHNPDYAIEEVCSEMELGVQNPTQRKTTTVKIYKVYVNGAMKFMAMDLTSAYHFIYVNSGYKEYITDEDFVDENN